MREVGVRELKEKTSAILREVCEKRESILITKRGKVVARLVPAYEKGSDWKKVWKEMDELAEKIGKVWPRGVSAAEAVAEQRREL